MGHKVFCKKVHMSAVAYYCNFLSIPYCIMIFFHEEFVMITKMVHWLFFKCNLQKKGIWVLDRSQSLKGGYSATWL